MSSTLSLSEFRQQNMTQLVLGSKAIEDMQVRSERILDILCDGRTVLDSFETSEKTLDDYDVVDKYRNDTVIPAYESQHGNKTKRFEVHLHRGRKVDESYNITRIDIVRDGTVEAQRFVVA